MEMSDMDTFTIRTPDYNVAVEMAEARVAESNAADFVGTPYTGYVIYAVEGIYSTLYEVSFTRPLTAATFAQAA